MDHDTPKTRPAPSAPANNSEREREERAARNRHVDAQERDEAPVWRPYDNTSGIEPLGYLVALALSSGEDGALSFATGALDAICDDLNALRLALLADGGANAIEEDLPVMLWRLSNRARCASELAWRKMRAQMGYGAGLELPAES
jgi:hypothetical protein